MAYNKRQKLQDNIKALEVAFDLAKSGRAATESEREALRKYSGFGGLKFILNPCESESDVMRWNKSDKTYFADARKLYNLLKNNAQDDKEYRSFVQSMRNSVLSSFYTPQPIVDAISGGLKDAGVEVKTFLDPSSGKGTFIDSFRQDHPDLKVTAFEKDLLTGLVLKSLHGDSDIHVAGYETIHEDYKNQFDVAASNIPFGDVNVFDPVYANSGDAAKVQATKTLHNYFFMKTLDEVRDGGLVAFITSQGVMDSTRNKNIRRAMLDKAYLVGAVRLPNNLFVDEAGTEVGSDLILLQKDSHKPADYIEYDPEERAFVENLSDMEAKNPQSSIENDFEKDEVEWYRKTNPNSYIFASQFFWDGESPYLGEISRGTDPYGKAATVCQWNGTMEELGQALRARVGFFMQHYFKHDLYKEHAPVITVIEEKPIPAQGESVSVTENLSMSEGQQVVSSPTLSSTGQPSRKKKGEVSSLQMSLFDLWDEQPQAAASQESAKENRMEPRAFAGDVLVYYRNGVIIEDAGQIGTLSEIDRDWMFKPLSLPRDTEDRLRQYVKVRDAYEDLYRTEAENQEEYAQGRADLNASYDEFVRRFGALNERKSMKAILMDACGLDMLCIERAVDGKYVKSDIFEKPVAFAVNEVTHVETAEEALMASLNRTGDVDLAYMSDLCDLTEDELRERLREKIYYNPMVRGYEIAERFLSGNVVEKMDYFEDNYGEKVLAAGEEEVGRSYKALQGVRPRPIPFEELDFNFGERWMPTSYFSEFATEFFGTEIQVEYAPNLDEFVIKCDEYWVDKITSEYAVQGESKNFTGLDLLRHALYDTTPIINKVVGYRANGDPIMGPDHEKMQLAASKIDAIREGFNEWIQGHPAKWKEAVADMYNRKFNCFVRANYDGSHQTFPDLDLKALKEKKGISDIYGSQKDAVWMILQNGGGICDHEVGTGKTLIMCLAAHEMKRLGMCHKPIIIGMKANVNEIAATYQSAYPNDRILYAPTESKDFKDRESFFNRMKNNDWDCIIMSHDQFNRIPQSEEVMRDVMYEEMQALEEALDVYAKQSRGGISSRMMKGLETRKENLAVELANLNYKLRNRADDVVDFKTMGIDHIFVDESQQYKNLPFTTRNNRVAGLGDPKGSQRARNLQYAIRTIQDRTGKDLGATFLSGTTISNSLTELYLLFKYLRPHALDAQDIHSFDAWAAIFARKSRDYEINVAGQIVMKERYRHFIKVPELAAFYNEITDYKTAVDVGLERPKMEVSLVNIQPTEDHQDFSKRLLEFAQRGIGELVFRPELNGSEMQAKMLLVTGMGKKASLSPKLVNPEYHEGDDTKIGFAARNIADYYRRYDEQKGTQFVFCDLSTPKKGEWSAYQELKDRLVNDYGIPEEEIQFIQDHGTERKRKAVIDKMNKGEVRVLIGSTTTLGTGVNAQERAVAVHHLDLPWRPSDMEQRNGRAVRKGNLVARDFADNKVDVLVYAVERSLDSYNFYLLQAKSDFIRQMKTGSLGKREFDQGGEDEENGMPFAEYVAITSGNTDLLERAKLEKRILGLESERKAFYKQQQVVQRKLDDARSQLTYQENILGKLEQDKQALEEVLSFKVDSDVDAFEALRDDSGLLSYTSDGRNVQLQHLTFDLTQDEPLGDYLQKAARQEVNGEADVLHLVEDGFDWPLVMTSQTEYNIKTGVNRWVGNHFAVRGESGILYTYNNGKVSLVSKKLAASYPFMAVARIPELIEAHEAKRDMYAKQIPELERIAGKEWEKAEELKNLKTQMQELDKKINMEMDIKTLQQQGQVTLPEQLPYEIEHHSYGRQPWGLKFAVKDFPFLTREDLNEIGDRYHGDIRSSYGEVRGDFRHQFGAEQAFKDLSKLNAEHRGDLDWLKNAASDIYDPSSVYAVKRLNEMGYDRHGNPLTGEDASRMKVISLGDYSIPEIRDLAHGVKDLHGVATEVAAAALSKVVSEMPDADKVVLVPMPGHKGYGGGAEKLCRLMSDLYDIPYENVLYSSSFESLYVWKKQHPNEPLPDLLFGARMDRINGKIPVLVDNVIDTGHTARAALDAIGGNPVMLVVGSTGKHEAEGDNIDVEVLDKGLELVHENTPEGVGFTGMSRKEFDNLLKLAQRFDDSSNAWKANHELRKYGIDKYTGYPLYMVEHISEKWDFTYEDLDEPVKELMSKGFADNVFTQEELERISPEDMKMFREAYVAAQDPDHIDYGYRRRLMVLYDVIREKLGIGVEQDAVSEAKDISMPRETVASDKGKMTVYAVDTYENDRFGGDLKSRANALLIYDNDATRLQAYGFWDRVISNLEKSDRERLVLVPMQFNQDESTAFLSKAVLAMWKHYQNKSLQEYKSIELRDTLRKVDNRWEFKDDVDPSKLYMLVDINMNDGHRLTQAREAFPENCEVKGLVLTYDPDFSEDYGDHIQVVTSKELEDERKAEYEADEEQTLNGYEAALEAFKGVTHLQPEEALDAQKLLWGSWNAPFAKENIRQKLLDEFDIDWQTGKRARFEYVDNTSANEGTSHVAEDDNTIRYMKGENYFSVREEGDLYVVDLGTKIDVLFDDMPEWFGKTDHELNGMFEKVTGVDGAVNNRGTFLDRETAERFAVAANEHYEHKLRELEEVASLHHTVQSKLRDALIDRMRKAGISVVTDVKEGQRVLDEANGDVSVKASKRIDELKEAEKFIEDSLKGKYQGMKLGIELPMLTERRIRSVIGKTFDSHNIFSNNIIHIRNRHGLGNEKQTDHIPLRDEDLKLIPYILVSPDRIVNGSIDSVDRESIRFEKDLTNGVVLVVEKEQKNSPNDMDVITMWATLSSRVADARSNERPLHSTSQPANVAQRNRVPEETDARTVITSFNIANVGHYARAMREGDMLSASNAFRGIKEEMGMWYKADHPESTLADFVKEFDSVKDDLFEEFGDLNELRAKKLPQYKDMSDEEINDFANLYMDYTTPMSNRSLTLRHLEEVMAYRHGESYADEWYEVRLRFPQYRNEFTSLVKDLPIRHQEAADALAAYESSMKEKYGEEWKGLINDDEDIHCVELQNAEYRLNPEEHEGYASIAYNQLVQRYGADYLLAFGHDDKNLIIKDELAAAFLMGVRQEMTDEDRVRVEQTEAFKDWFGDWQQYPDAASKVVDQNGRPMVMYHGTGAENAFSIFDLSKSGKSNTLAGVGFWFTPSEEFAKSWGEEVFYNRDGAHVLPVYLNIRNPKIYRPLTEEQLQEGERVKGELNAVREEISSINKQYENDYYHSVIGYYDLNTFETAKRNGFVVDNDEESERIKEHYRTRSEHGREAMSDGEKVYQLMQREEELSKQYDFYRHPDPYEQFRYDVYTVAGRPQDANIGGLGMALSHPKEVLEQFREQLKAQGYDGIIIEDTKYDRRYAGTETTTQYITFDANQIKSATQNIGRFRTENEDIRYQNVSGYTMEEIEEKLGSRLTNNNYNQILAINPFVNLLRSDRISEYVDYRSVIPTPSLNDYYAATRAEFKNVGAVPTMGFTYDVREVREHLLDEPWVFDIAQKGDEYTHEDTQRIVEDFIGKYWMTAKEEVTSDDVRQILTIANERRMHETWVQALLSAEAENLAKWEEMKGSGQYEFQKSPKSNSEYLLDRQTGDIYRFSNHWGVVASCEWGIDQFFANEAGNGIYQIAKCNIADFKPILSSNMLVGNPDYDNAYIDALDKTISNYEQLLASRVEMTDFVRQRVESVLEDYKTLQKRYDEEHYRAKNGVRYHKVDTYPIFVSNAQLAVERIQQQKATPMQWLNMITKNGGIKAGEDKWMGLSVWLKENTSKTLTKGEVLDFISQNAIEVEEVNYVNPSDYTITKEDILESEAFQYLQDSFIEYDDDGNPYVDQERFNQRRHEDNNFFNGFSIDYWGEGIDVDDLRSAALYLGLIDGNRVREINDTRLGYTTEGLEKNREIALTVPSIEPWKEGDSIHFGDAGDGRAVVWVRFGETTVKKDVPYVKEVTEFEEPYTNYRGDEIYVPKGQSRFDMNDMIEKINPEAHYGKEGYYVYVDHAIVGFEPTMERAIEAMNEYYYLHPSVRQETERVLVVDEIQSKRHQDGRKVGYIPQYTEARVRAYEAASKAYRAAVDAYREHVSKIFRQYDEGADPFTPGKRAIDRWRDVLTEDERAEYYRLRKDMNDKQDVVISLQMDGFIDRSKVPDAPFEKNWQELAMKRVLRYAADNGYDRVAWTTGEQQSERYNIGDVVDAIDVSPYKAQSSIEVDGFDVTIITEDRDNIEMYVTQEGIVSSSDKPAYRGKHLSEVVGKSLSDKILSDPEGGFYQGEDLRLGGEGMRAFYDQMLVNYMNKYGKQWGAQVEDVELSRLGYRGERPVMHSVVVNAAMKDSVLQGQPMFFKARDGRAYGFVKGGVIYIDRAIATAETPLHEYTHLWAEALRQKNPDEWKNVVELMKGATDIWNKVKREYPDLTDDDSIADEVLAQYSGKRGYQKLMDETKGQEDMSVLDKLAEALARFWKAVADFLHIHYTSKEQVADQVLHDLLTGVNPLEYADKMVDQRETESFKEWFGDWEKSRLLSQVDLEKMQEAFDDIKNNLPQKSKEARKIYDDFAFDMGTKYGFDWLEQLTDEEREEEHNLLNYREYYDLEENDINELAFEELQKRFSSNITEVVSHSNGQLYTLYELEELEVSKVVDAEGKPLVVEHATNADFTVFDMSHIGENSKDNGVFGAGFYFGTHAPGWMQGAKNIMKVYLDIKHPFEVTDDVVDIYTEIREKMDTPAMRSLVVKGFNDHEEHLGVLIDQIKYVDDLIKNHPNEVQEMMLKDEELEYVRPDDRLRVWREHEIMNRSGLGSLALSWQSFINHQIGSHEFTAAAIQDGYDGVIVDRGNDYKEYVVFEANQIKSATYNVGTFNLNSNDIRFHFIGEEGARQLDQNLGGNYNSFLEKAKYCENMGYAPHYIKFVTGWEKGVDGKWRYELGGIRDFNPYGNQDWLSRHPEVVRYRELHQRDVAQVMGIDGFQPLSEEERNEMEALAKDSNVRYFDGTATQKNPASLTVKDYMDAPMLFAAYPELRDLPVKVEPLTSNGKYVSEVDALTGDTSRYLVISDALVQSLRDMNASARQQMQDTFIHEIQHYIQEMEGFARGGNLSTVATMRRDEAQAKLDALRPVYEEYQYLDACIDSAEDSEMALQYYDAKDAFEKEHAHELKAYQVALDARHVAELDMVSGYLSDRNFIDYQRLAGEVEARNAVRRSGMSFRERWNSPISSTEDVPREEQIVNYRSSMAASLESPSTRKLTVADREAGGALVEQLEKMGITVHTDLEENRKKLREFLLDKSDAGKVRYMETEAGQVYGFSYKGEMYLDMRKVDAELPLARYAHLWAASMRRVNPDNWKHVVGMFKSDADTWKALQEAYPQYSNEDDLVEAAIVKYSGKQGAEKMQRQLQNMSTRDADYKSRWGNIFQNVSRAIQDFWKHVGDSFNIRYSSKEELADQILKDFTNSVNPVKKVEKWLQERDKAYAEAVARNDMDTARDLFWEALQENVGNGITPFMAVDGYRGKLDRLARDIKDEGNTEAINKAADLMAPYIRAGMVLVPAPGHEGYATHTLALAHAISERSHVPVADVLVGVERARQYDVKKATGKPILAEQLGIRKMGELPKWYGVERLPVVIDNVVHSGNTAEACVKALGKGVVLSLASAVSQERHVASLKSLAPVVYGKDDQLIPLSKRFELKSKWLGRAVSNLSPADPKIQGLESYSLEDIKELVSAHVNGILEESFSGEDISIKEITVIGSRSRGEAHEGSDLDILVEYEGDGVREDAMFDALNEAPLEIEGIKVDINPINPHYSLSTSQWLERDAKWREQDANNSNQLNNSETMKSKVKQRNASTRDKLSNLLAGLLPNNGDRITVFDKGDSGLNDPRTFKEVGYIAREDGHYNYHQGEDQVDIYELQPESDVVKKLYSRALAVEISDQLDEGQRFDNMKSLGSRYQGDGSFVRKENGLLYISGRADGEVVTDWLSVRPEVLEALSDEIEDRYDLLAARERLANLVHDAESISFPEPLHMQFPNADFDYPVIALRDTSVFGVHSYYGNEWPFIVEYQTEHGTNQMNPDMTEDMYNVLSDKIEETVSLKQVFTKLLPENADVLEIEQPWVVDQPIGVKDGKEIKVEDVHHAIDVDDGKNVFVAGSERTGYVNVNRLMAWDQQKVLAQAVQALNAKTLKERFDAFINEHHEEPKYAEVTIRFKDDDVRQNVIIQLDHGADPKIDDNIFFYCGGLNDLIGMTDEENAEDFVLVDVEDTIFHSKALFRNDVETLLSDVILRADELGIDYHPIALKGDISMDVLNLDLNEQLEPKTFKYATVTKDNVILFENLADVFDNNKGYSLDDMPTDAQQEVLDRAHLRIGSHHQR